MFVDGLGTGGIKAVGFIEELELSDQKLKQAFISVAGAGGVMSEAIERSSQAWERNTALTIEAELRYATTESQLAIMGNKFTDLGITIGTIFLPVIRAVSSALGLFATVLNAIAGTTVGKVVLGIVAGLAALLVVGGLVLIFMGAARFAAAQAAISFAAMGKAEIAAAFATGGLTAGMAALATSIWAAMAPLLPFLIVGAGLVGIFFFLKKAVSEFNDVLKGTSEVASGFTGFMQRLGGVIAGAIHVWQTATTEGFTMTQGMHDTLSNLGILEIVIQIGTWAVRIRAIASGMGDVFSAVWKGLKFVGRLILDMVNSVFDLLNEMGFSFTKLGGDIDTFILIGQVMAAIMTGLFIAAIIAVTIATASWAIATIAATWPILAIIAAIIAVILIIANWGAIADWFSGVWSDTFDFITVKFKDFIEWFTGMKDIFFDWGSGIVNSIREGIASQWDSLMSWFLELVTSFPGGTLLLNTLGVDIPGSEGISTTTDFNPDAISPIGAAVAGVSAANAEAQQPFIIDNTTNTETIKSIAVFLDGRKIRTRIEEIDEDENNRL